MCIGSCLEERTCRSGQSAAAGVRNSQARTAVHADDAVLDERGQGEPVEEGVEPRPGPDALLVAQPLYALQPEAEQRVYVRRLRRAAPALPQHLLFCRCSTALDWMLVNTMQGATAVCNKWISSETSLSKCSRAGR